ncbi:MAG: GNVR domain-containing protein [Bryobacteraceae bacterium]
MQPGDGFNTPRRTLDIEDYIDIVRRHKGWMVGPFLLTLVASIVGVYLYPDTYVSQAVVKIVPQQVPTNMVQAAINQQMNDRINSMAQTILSRTTLTTIINTFGLYPRERARMPIEDVLELMKKKIQILPVATPAGTSSPTDRIPAFAVQFAYENKYLAQRVVQDLVSRFIDENIRSRSNAVFQTYQFLRDQTDSSKKELDAAENKLTAFRMQNNGKLPDQLDSNMRQLVALQTQAGFLDSQVARANQDKLQLESNLRIFKDQLTALGKPVEVLAAGKSERLILQERDVQSLETQLALLRQKYKENYPDVQNGIAQLDIARKKLADLEAEEKRKDDTPKKTNNQQQDREMREADANVRRLQTAIEGRDIEIATAQKEMKRVAEAIKAYQGRIETVPIGQQQYTELLRDQQMARDKYLDLDSKLQRAGIAQDMEGRKQGETLELLDPASLPTEPTEPNRPVVISVGAVFGLLLGIVIAGGREMKDTSLKNLKDVRAYTQMAILGSVPLLENDFVVRRRRRLAWLGWTTACLAAAVIISGSVVYYYVTRAS